jgi:amidase
LDFGRRPISEICRLTARELARLLRARELSAVEVTAAHLGQIDRLNPKLNAIVTLTAERAREAARSADESAERGEWLGPLHGLPVVHKDLHETRGVRTTYGSPIFQDHVPAFDALIVERMRRAGAIMLGKSNTPEFGAGSQTFNPVFGATRNPYDLSKTCGGSSGGAAVALACGMAALAEGSDTGGSLRNPASFCSIAGFRPSPGRVPMWPSAASWNTLSVAGPMARNVGDVALLLSAIAGPHTGSPVSIAEDGARFGAPLDRDFRGVRLAWCSAIPGVPFERGVREAVALQRKTFASLGCEVEEAHPDFSGADEAFRTLRALEFYENHAAKLAEHRNLMKATVIQEIERGARLTGPEIADAEMQRSRLFERVGEFMRTYEFLVLPTVQVAPFDIDQPYVTEIEGVKMEGYIDWMRSCYYISMTGHPAISVPAGFTPEGLPVGLQIVGRHLDDWGVLQMAHTFEQASGVSGTFPPIVRNQATSL